MYISFSLCLIANARQRKCLVEYRLKVISIPQMLLNRLRVLHNKEIREINPITACCDLQSKFNSLDSLYRAFH